jgi:adenosylcobinamide-phosphate synthase
VAVELAALGSAPLPLVIAVGADLAVGDPVYRFHPVRLVGATILALEDALRRIGADGYLGGVVLTIGVSFGWTAGLTLLIAAAWAVTPWLGWLVHVFVLYSFVALGDLVRHVTRVEAAASSGEIDRARQALSHLVGRDTAAIDAEGCRRAAIESLSESLTDGFTSAVFWYVIAGIPGLVLFKVVSTLDSMVGYKTPRYLQFGWCGARADDVMNYVPARLTWLLLAATAAVVPRCSARKACVIGWRQHRCLPGPNAGWSEAAAAGAIERRLVGPIWNHGALVTDIWIGDPRDPPAGSADDVSRALTLVLGAGLVATLLASAVLWLIR